MGISYGNQIEWHRTSLGCSVFVLVKWEAFVLAIIKLIICPAICSPESISEYSQRDRDAAITSLDNLKPQLESYLIILPYLTNFVHAQLYCSKGFLIIDRVDN